MDIFDTGTFYKVFPLSGVFSGLLGGLDPLSGVFSAAGTLRRQDFQLWTYSTPVSSTRSFLSEGFSKDISGSGPTQRVLLDGDEREGFECSEQPLLPRHVICDELGHVWV